MPQLFVDLTGKFALLAMLYQQLNWSDRSVRRDGFVYKTALEWKEEVGASTRTVHKFNQLPYIETNPVKAKGHPTTHYKVRIDVLMDLIDQFILADKNGTHPQANR